MTKTDDLVPGLTWTQLQTLLMSMADTPEKKAMVPHLVEGTRKQAPFLTPEGNLKEIIYIGAVMLDVRFKPPVLGRNTSPASSPSPPSQLSPRW